MAASAAGGLTSRKRAWAAASHDASTAICSNKQQRRGRNVETLLHTGLLHLGHGNARLAAQVFERADGELDETARGPRAKARKRRELAGLLGACAVLRAPHEPKAHEALANACAKLQAAARGDGDAADGGGAGAGAGTDAACWLNCAGLAYLLRDDAAAAGVWFERAAAAAASSPQDLADASCNAALAPLLTGQPPTPGSALVALTALEAAARASAELGHLPSRINLSAGLVCAGRSEDVDAATAVPTAAVGEPGAALLLNNRGIAQAARRRPERAAATFRRAAAAPLEDASHVQFNHAVATAGSAAVLKAASENEPAAVPEQQRLPALDAMVSDMKYCAPPLLGGAWAARHAKPKPASSSTAYRALGTARGHQGLLFEAVEIDPNDWAAWREWGMGLLTEGGDSDDAIAYCTQACRRADPQSSPAALCALGTAVHLIRSAAAAPAAGFQGTAEEIYQRALDQLDRQGAPPSCPVRHQLTNNLANWLRCEAS